MSDVGSLAYAYGALSELVRLYLAGQISKDWLRERSEAVERELREGMQQR